MADPILQFQIARMHETTRHGGRQGRAIVGMHVGEEFDARDALRPSLGIESVEVGDGGVVGEPVGGGLMDPHAHSAHGGEGEPGEVLGVPQDGFALPLLRHVAAAGVDHCVLGGGHPRDPACAPVGMQATRLVGGQPGLQRRPECRHAVGMMVGMLEGEVMAADDLVGSPPQDGGPGLVDGDEDPVLVHHGLKVA